MSKVLSASERAQTLLLLLSLLYATTKELIMAYFWCIEEGRFILIAGLFDIISTLLNRTHEDSLGTTSSQLPTLHLPIIDALSPGPRLLFLLALGQWKGGQKEEVEFSSGSCTQNKVGSHHPAWPIRKCCHRSNGSKRSEKHKCWTHIDLSLLHSFASVPYSALHGCGMIF